MSKHPYPEHVAEAVAGQFAGLLGYVFGDLPEHDQDLFRRNAGMILQAIWDASRVDTLDELDDLPWDYVVIDRTGFVSDGQSTREDIHDDDLPAHVIYWGDSDE